MNPPHNYGPPGYGPAGPAPGAVGPGFIQHGQQGGPGYARPPGYGGPAYGPGAGGAPPQKRGMHGCLIAFFIALGVGVLAVIGFGIYLYKEFGTLVGGIGEVAAVMLEAQSAPGTSELRGIGCDQAYAVDTVKLQKAIQKVEDEVAKKEGRAPKKVDIMKDGGKLVGCTVTGTKMPSCDEVASTYVSATSPGEPFMVNVSRKNSGASCAERYSADGKSLGKALPVDIPK